MNNPTTSGVYTVVIDLIAKGHNTDLFYDWAFNTWYTLTLEKEVIPSQYITEVVKPVFIHPNLFKHSLLLIQDSNIELAVKYWGHGLDTDKHLIDTRELLSNDETALVHVYLEYLYEYYDNYVL